MHIRLSYDIQFEIPSAVAMVTLLNVHPSRAADLLESDELKTDPGLEVSAMVSGIVVRGSLRLQGNSNSMVPRSFETPEFRMRSIGMPASRTSAVCHTKCSHSCSPAATVRWIVSQALRLNCSDKSRRAGAVYKPFAIGSTTK
jgi:hypothetical protein